MEDQSQQSRDQQASQFLSDLINGGILDTTLQPFDERETSVNYLHWFQKIKHIKRVFGEPQTYELWTAAQSQRWQENSLATVPLSPATDYHMVELARFAVPDGHIGFINNIEQDVADLQGNYYATNVSYWGSIYNPLTDVRNLRWYLTLSYFDGTMPPRWQVNSTTPIAAHDLPGQPYTDLFEINGIWYPAHNNKALKLLVPGGRLLRFFIYSPPLLFYDWMVTGKLTGTTQSTYQLAALKNARDLW